jgi:hypothetical protein
VAVGSLLPPGCPLQAAFAGSAVGPLTWHGLCAIRLAPAGVAWQAWRLMLAGGGTRPAARSPARSAASRRCTCATAIVATPIRQAPIMLVNLMPQWNAGREAASPVDGREESRRSNRGVQLPKRAERGLDEPLQRSHVVGAPASHIPPRGGGSCRAVTSRRRARLANRRASLAHRPPPPGPAPSRG